MDTEWLEKWFYEAGNAPITAIGEYFEGEPFDMSLKTILNIHPEDIKPFAQELVKPGGGTSALVDSLTELRWGLRAYFQFQDILIVSSDVNTPFDSVAFRDRYRQNYCYYESLVYLRESIVSWLDRNVLASLTLLRPFLELAVFQVYWILLGSGHSSERYHQWLKSDKEKLFFTKTLDDVFRTMPARISVADRRLTQLKETIRSCYKTLCAYQHVPRFDESVAAKAPGLGNTAYESFFYAILVSNICLRQVVLLYVLAYPMSLFPVERHKKWAFGGPMGLFFDRCNYAILERYLGSRNTSLLKRSLTEMRDVKELLEWYDQFPTLSDVEIEADWQRFLEESPNESDASTLGDRLVRFKARNRALGWLVNYSTNSEPDDNLSDEAIERLAKRIENW